MGKIVEIEIKDEWTKIMSILNIDIKLFIELFLRGFFESLIEGKAALHADIPISEEMLARKAKEIMDRAIVGSDLSLKGG